MSSGNLRTLAAELEAGDEIGFYGPDDDEADASAIVLRSASGQFKAWRRSGDLFGTFPTLEAAEDAIRAALTAVPADETSDDDGQELEALCAALAAGEEVGFRGVGDPGDGMPRLTLRAEAGRLRLRDRSS